MFYNYSEEFDFQKLSLSFVFSHISPKIDHVQYYYGRLGELEKIFK